MTNIVKWGAYDIEAAKQEREELEKGGGSGGQFLKLNIGRNQVRFLPPPPGKKSPFVKTYQHFVRMPNQQRPVVANCPRRMGGGRCPLCAHADKLMAKSEELAAQSDVKGSQAARDQAFNWFSKLRVFAAVIDRGAPEKGVQIYAFGKKIYEQLAAMREDEDAGGDFSNPVNGFDIVIEREGQTKNDTKYMLRAGRTSALDSDVTPDMIPDLERYAKPHTGDQIEAMMRGEDPNEAKAASAEAPAPRVASGRKARTAQDDIEDAEYE